jgi:cutinase
MKTVQFMVSLLAGLATAAPTDINIRQTANVGITENEYTIGGCRDIIFFFARGSTEVGNMVRISPCLR